MKRRFTEEQIIGVLREQEAGAQVSYMNMELLTQMTDHTSAGSATA